ncbi:predicted protein [Histoplasma capsulatum var. duboisii H88]|uniref:Predicted protein n=1 Tax=Ajellomyces capsulatus (strain H88) TaxID=544711 RepID=F0U6F6_AJEC8|nr:predicted protein [Histoplasma capsulatum var. duboisii H88]
MRRIWAKTLCSASEHCVVAVTAALAEVHKEVRHGVVTAQLRKAMMLQRYQSYLVPWILTHTIAGKGGEQREKYKRFWLEGREGDRNVPGRCPISLNKSRSKPVIVVLVTWRYQIQGTSYFVKCRKGTPANQSLKYDHNNLNSRTV